MMLLGLRIEFEHCSNSGVSAISLKNCRRRGFKRQVRKSLTKLSYRKSLIGRNRFNPFPHSNFSPYGSVIYSSPPFLYGTHRALSFRNSSYQKIISNSVTLFWYYLLKYKVILNFLCLICCNDNLHLSARFSNLVIL